MAREKTLHSSKCDRCGLMSFPPMIVCPKCGPDFMKEVKQAELPSLGIVVTWTKVHVTPPGFPSPLLMCIADFGVNMLGTLHGNPEIQEGDKVRIIEDPSGKLPFQFAVVKS